MTAASTSILNLMQSWDKAAFGRSRFRGFGFSGLGVEGFRVRGLGFRV